MFNKVFRMKCHNICYVKYFGKIKVDEADMGKHQQLLRQTENVH